MIIPNNQVTKYISRYVLETSSVKKTLSSPSHGTKTSPRRAVSKDSNHKPHGTSSTTSSKKDDILSFEKIRVSASLCPDAANDSQHWWFYEVHKRALE